MNINKKIIKFLLKAKVFYAATVDNDYPKCRPLSFVMEHKGRIYFGVGKQKDAYKQLQVNPNIEICASLGEEFIRIYGKATFDETPNLFDKAIDVMPSLRDTYNQKTGNEFALFYLMGGSVEFHTLTNTNNITTF